MNRVLELLFVLTLCCTSLRAEDRPNVLFLAVDDMNDWVGFLFKRHLMRLLPISIGSLLGVFVLQMGTRQASFVSQPRGDFFGFICFDDRLLHDSELLCC